MKHATNFEVLLFKKPLDARLHQLLAYTPELNLGSITDLEFISNFQAIQVHYSIPKLTITVMHLNSELILVLPDCHFFLYCSL